MSATLNQIANLISALGQLDPEQVKHVLESKYLIDVIQTKHGDFKSAEERVVAAEDKFRKAEQKLRQSEFRAQYKLVEKLVDPEDLVVVRSRIPKKRVDKYSNSTIYSYNMSFWKKEGGVTSEEISLINDYYPQSWDGDIRRIGSNYLFIFNFLSWKAQPEHLRYPMEGDDLSRMYEDGRTHRWHRETLTNVDIFTLRKES